MQTSAEQLCTRACTRNGYFEDPVSDDTLRQLYVLLKCGPTAADCWPARFVRAHTAEQKDRLAQCVNAGNAGNVRQAPVTVIIGIDGAFSEQLPRLFPHTDARPWFVGKPELIAATAFRNSSFICGIGYGEPSKVRRRNPRLPLKEACGLV